MSIFLMGVWDPATKQWCTVAKCGNGHDDKTIEKLNKQLKMRKISKVCKRRTSYSKHLFHFFFINQNPRQEGHTFFFCHVSRSLFELQINEGNFFV